MLPILLLHSQENTWQEKKQSFWICIKTYLQNQVCLAILYLPQAAYRGRHHMCSNAFGIEWRCVSHSEILQEVRSSVPCQVEGEHCWKHHGSPEITKNKQTKNYKFSIINKFELFTYQKFEIISSNSFRDELCLEYNISFLVIVYTSIFLKWRTARSIKNNYL